MKKLFALSLSFAFLLSFSPISFAAIQVIDVNPEALDADGMAEGVMFAGDNELTVADTENIGDTAGLSVDPGADNTGTITFAGDTTVSGAIGTGTADDLNLLDVIGGAGNTVTLNGDVYTDSLNVADNALVQVNGSLDASTLNLLGAGSRLNFISSEAINITQVVAASDGFGILDFGNVTFTGSIGSLGLSVASVLTEGAGTTINGDIFVSVQVQLSTDAGQTVTINGDVDGIVGFLEDNILVLTDDSDVLSTVRTTVDNQGTLTLQGDNTISGQVGAMATKLKAINLGAGAGESIVFGSSVFATTTNVTDLGTSSFTANLTSDLNYSGDGVVELSDNANLTGAVTAAVDGTGTLTLLGSSTVSGSVGTALSTLDTVNAGANAETATFSGDVFAGTLNVSGTGNVALNGSLTGDLTYDAGGTVTLADNENLTGVVMTATNNTGTLTLAGTSTVSGEVGTAMNRVATVNAGATGETATFSDNVFATTLSVSGSGGVDLSGSFSGTTLNFGGDGTVTLADGASVTAAVTTTTTQTGTLTLDGSSAITGQIGSAPLELSEVRAGAAGATATFNNEVFAQTLTVTDTGEVEANDHLTLSTLNFAGDGTVTVADNADLTASTAISTNTNNTGTLVFNGTSTVGGGASIGSDSNSLKLVRGAFAGETVTVNGDVHSTTLRLVGAGGTMNISGDIDSNVIFEGNALLPVASGKNISGTVTTEMNDAGTLRYLGNSTTGGAIGSVGMALNLIEFSGAAGTTLTVAHNIIATTLDDAGTGGSIVMSGSRTITGDIQMGAGTLELGSTTLTNNGTGIFSTDATTTINSTILSTATFGKIVASGNASVASGTTFDLTVSGALANGNSFNLLDGAAGGTVGSVTIIEDSLRYDFTVNNASGDLVLTAVSDSVSSASNSNNAQVAASLDSLANATGDMGDIQTILNNFTQSSELDNAFSAMLPAIDGGSMVASLSASNGFQGTISDRLSGISSGDVMGLSSGEVFGTQNSWFKGFGGYLDQDSRQGVAGYSAYNLGSTLGYDKLFTDDLRLGLAGGYAYGNVDSDNSNNATTDINSYLGSIYGRFSKDPWYIDFNTSFTWHEYEGDREINFASIHRVAEYDTDGQQYGFYAEYGYNIERKSWQFTPLASIAYTRLDISEYSESGAGSLNLAVNDQEYDILQSGLGLKISKSFFQQDASVWIPSLKAKWLYDFEGDEIQTTSTFSAGGTSFNTTGFSPAQSSFLFGAELALITRGSWTVQANYDLEVKSDFYSHNGALAAKYTY